MSAALELSDSVGKAVACRALGVPRASLYRRMLPAAPRRVRPTPARALTATNGRPCSIICTRNASGTRPRRRSMPP